MKWFFLMVGSSSVESVCSGILWWCVECSYS